MLTDDDDDDDDDDESYRWKRMQDSSSRMDCRALRRNFSSAESDLERQNDETKSKHQIVMFICNEETEILS